MFSLSDVFYSRYTSHLLLSNPSLFLSQMYSSQGILYIYCYLTRPYFSLWDVFFSRYTLHLLLSNTSLFLSQMYSTQGILYIFCYRTRPFFLYNCTAIYQVVLLYTRMYCYIPGCTAIYQVVLLYTRLSKSTLLTLRLFVCIFKSIIDPAIHGRYSFVYKKAFSVGIYKHNFDWAENCLFTVGHTAVQFYY